MVSLAVFVAILTVVAVVFEFTLAGVVLAAGPRRGVNRTLAILLVGKAVTIPPGVVGTLVDNRAFDYWATVVLWACGFLILGVYPWFMSYVLDTPLTRPFRHPVVRWGLVAASTICAVVVVAFPRQVLIEPGTHVPGHGWTWEFAPFMRLGLLVYLALVVFAFIAAIDAFRRTTSGTAARRRGKAYLIAFTTQDVGVAIALVYWFLNPTDIVGPDLLNAILQFAFASLVAFALLRYQIFDFELRLKAAVARTTMAAILLAGFIGASAVAQQYLQQYGVLVGGAAVGALLIAIAPIRHLANSLADRMFPGVSRNPDYLTRKKVEVYREALRDATRLDGTLDDGQAMVLRDLRNSLGLTQRDHDVILSALQGSPGPTRPARITPGATVLGKYRVERELGAGGGGRAFLATDLRMRRKVVLKALPAENADQSSREARAAAAIDHPNVVRMYDVENLGDQAIIVMEYVDGGSLKERIATSGPLSDTAFARVADDILAALEAVHATGAVHRDVKPSNVLLTRDGRAKLADFGIAHLPGFETTTGSSESGTVQYMSPEQARGKRVTAASDLYSAAATLYEAKKGRPVVEPLPEETPVEMRMRVGATPRVKVTLSPSPLRTWFARAFDAEKRFGTAVEMRRALAAALRRPAGAVSPSKTRESSDPRPARRPV